MLVEAMDVRVDTDILHTDLLGSLLHFLFSSQHPHPSFHTASYLVVCTCAELPSGTGCCVCRLRELEVSGCFSAKGQTLASCQVYRSRKPCALASSWGKLRCNLPLRTLPLMAPSLGLIPLPVLLPHSLISLPGKHFFKESFAHKFSSQGLSLGMCT